MNTGDLEPPWVVDITAGDTETDFSTVESWRFWAYRETLDGKAEAFDDAAADATPGSAPHIVAVSHAWVQGETDTPGVIHAVPIAVWPGGREQSFPGASITIGTDGTI